MKNQDLRDAIEELCKLDPSEIVCVGLDNYSPYAYLVLPLGFKHLMDVFDKYGQQIGIEDEYITGLQNLGGDPETVKEELIKRCEEEGL